MVQRSPSLHATPSVAAACPQVPVTASQVSAVQESASSQDMGWPEHCPAWQRSAEVQALPSEHAVPSAAAECAHAPLRARHSSSVQLSESAQDSGEPAQTPAEHRSEVVHGLPSEQGAPSAAALKTHPVPATHSSRVQALPSLQLTKAPVHEPVLQVSDWVQMLLSSHAVPLATTTETQMPDASQASAVHGLPSSQCLPRPLQWPPAHSSPAVHEFPSSQAVWLTTLPCRQAPVCPSQASVVQNCPSSQLTARPAQSPDLHRSWCVHAFVSSQGVPFAAAVWKQPATDWQPSAVQPSPSLQSRGKPATQRPEPSQVSVALQASPSSQAPPAARL